jgi:hypothetical protein
MAGERPTIVVKVKDVTTGRVWNVANESPRTSTPIYSS